VNLSVWESVEALWSFVYASRHLDLLRRTGPSPDAFTLREPFPAPGGG